MFPTKEAGDFLNAKFVMIKYDLDKADPDNIKTKFSVSAYPTFIFLDTEGKEVNRMLGGAKSAKEFIQRITEAIAPENSHAAREKRFKEDPSYAIDYLIYLRENLCMRKEADEALIELFNRRKPTENFNKESIQYYSENVNDLQSPIIQYMLKNSKEVKNIMGEENYNQFMTRKTNDAISKLAYTGKFDQTALKKAIDDAQFQTAYMSFLLAIKDASIANDLNATLKIANEFIKKADTDSRQRILAMIKTVASGKSRTILDENKEVVLKFLADCLNDEVNGKTKKDPSYVMEYIAYMKNNLRMEKEADEALMELFNRRKPSENFNKESIQYYSENVDDLQSPIIQYMLKNDKEVKRVMGKENYNQFMAKKANRSVFKSIYTSQFDLATLENAIAYTESQKVFQTAYTSFIATIKDAFIAKDLNAALKVANESIKKADTDSRKEISSIIHTLALNKDRTIGDENIDVILKFLANCQKYETDSQMKELFGKAVERFKN